MILQLNKNDICDQLFTSGNWTATGWRSSINGQSTVEFSLASSLSASYKGIRRWTISVRTMPSRRQRAPVKINHSHIVFRSISCPFVLCQSCKSIIRRIQTLDAKVRDPMTSRWRIRIDPRLHVRNKNGR